MNFLVDQGYVSEHAVYLRKRLAFESTMQDNVATIFRSVIPEFQKSLNDASSSMIEAQVILSAHFLKAMKNVRWIFLKSLTIRTSQGWTSVSQKALQVY